MELVRQFARFLHSPESILKESWTPNTRQQHHHTRHHTNHHTTPLRSQRPRRHIADRSQERAEAQMDSPRGKGGGMEEEGMEEEGTCRRRHPAISQETLSRKLWCSRDTR